MLQNCMITKVKTSCYLRRFFYLVNALGHMSFITHSGYGYSKELCEDVTSWFLNNFFPRHKIDVEIVHRDLKEEHVRGYCDVVGDSYRPRDFLIELDTYYMTKELYIQTLFCMN